MLKQHLARVVEGAAFRGSRRSAQFLEYIVQQVVDGNGDQLKERVIGMELFGRAPTYDTGEDAIVRVTASDVRKRLIQHYRLQDSGEFRLHLRPGTYAPELLRNVPKVSPATIQSQSVTDVETSKSGAMLAESDRPMVAEPRAGSSAPGFFRRWILLAVTFAVLASGLAGWMLLFHTGRVTSRAAAEPANSSPWGDLFDGAHPLLVVASDPNIAEIQSLTHQRITLSDYANQRWLPPDTSHLAPLQIQFMQQVLIGNKISDYDGQVIAELASVLPSGSHRLLVHAARATRIQELESNENVILLGSTRSNPWASLFDAALDFHYVHDEQLHGEYITNTRPTPGELNQYVPSANGYGTGQSFATVSFFKNPGHAGHVLIISGANGEGTEAAGDLVGDQTRWPEVGKACHLPAAGSSPASLQLLLRLNTMAGSPRDVHIVACHLLPSES